MVLHLKKLESLSSKDACAIDWNSKVLEKRIFQFRYFVIISPWKRAGPFIWKKLESPSPLDTFCQIWLKLAQWIWRKGFLNFFNVFSLFCNYLHLEKGGALLLNKLEFPSPKDTLCQVWLKLAQWFWRRRLFIFAIL